MASMPWVKMYTEILNDHKLRELRDGTKWRFVQMMLLAGEFDQEGFIPMGFDDLVWRLHVDDGRLLDDLDALEAAGLIEIVEGGHNVVNFSKRQGRSQTEKREQWKERQKRHRDKEKDVTGDKNNVTPLEESRGEEIRVDKDIEERKRKRRRKKPKDEWDIPDNLDIPEFRKAWQDFQKHRKEIRKKLTPLAGTRTLAKLAKHPSDIATRMLERSIENGWTGVFELDGDKPSPKPKKSVAEILEER